VIGRARRRVPRPATAGASWVAASDPLALPRAAASRRFLPSEFGQCAESEHFSVSNDICSLKTHFATKTLISVSWVYRVSVRIVLTDSADFNPVTRG
jgi:hypothetical protein